MKMTGSDLPKLKTSIPGPRSRRWTRQLIRYECPNLTGISKDSPIFWEEASGANVKDVDGNLYIDLSGGFGVNNTGHGNLRIREALTRQAKKLTHGLGDIHPTASKVQLLKTLSKIVPRPLAKIFLATSGSEAVEIALKTARLATGKMGILAFEGAYHGLTYGVLPATDLLDFRGPFSPQLGTHVRHVPFPAPHSSASLEKEILVQIEEILQQGAIGAVLIEPVQGRGGIRIAPSSFMKALRKICVDHRILLIADEIYSGMGRTGRLFAFQHSGIVPDLITLGKGLTGGFPIAACIGTQAVMSAWPRHHGEALHTSTFLGNPLGCAMALTSIQELQSEKLIAQAKKMGTFCLQRLQQSKNSRVKDVRGLGLMIGIELNDAQKAHDISMRCLKRGIILVTEGVHQNVLAITPPLVITKKQIKYAIHVIHEEINRE